MASKEEKMTLRKKENKNNSNNSIYRRTAMCLMAVLVLCIFTFFGMSRVYADPNDAEAAEATGTVESAGTAGVTDAAETTESPVTENGAFEVTGYDMTAAVGKDHSYTVEEKISVNIPAQLDKMEFAIPSGRFRIEGIEVENVAYETKKASEASKVAITDAAKLSEGAHEYTIKYKIREYEDRDAAKDMFYFNVLLPEWKQPIGKVSISVSFPEDFPFDDMHCYAGQYGVQDVNNKIAFDAKESEHIVTVNGEKIPENFGITLKAQLPEGYWENELDGNWSLAAIILVMAGVSLLLLLLWVIGGKDPKVRKQTVTKPIEGLSPVELGYVFNSEVRTRDVLHMILQFAQKGYLSISEYEPKRYRIIKGKRPVGEEKMYRSAYGILFEDVYKGRAVEMDKIPARLEKIRASIENDVAAGFTSNDDSPFTPMSRTFRYVGAAVLGAGLALANGLSYFYGYQDPKYLESVIIGAAAAFASLMLCKVIDQKDSSSTSAGIFAEIMSSLMIALPVLYAAYRVSANTGKPVIGIPLVAASAFAVFLIVIMRARGKNNAVLVSRIRRLRNFIYHPTPKELLENHLADDQYYYDMMLYALVLHCLQV